MKILRIPLALALLFGMGTSISMLGISNEQLKNAFLHPVKTLKQEKQQAKDKQQDKLRDKYNRDKKHQEKGRHESRYTKGHYDKRQYGKGQIKKR
jgi:hypothetical protein